MVKDRNRIPEIEKCLLSNFLTAKPLSQVNSSESLRIGLKLGEALN